MLADSQDPIEVLQVEQVEHVKLNTTCGQTLLPLYYMPYIISEIMIFFLYIHNHWQYLLYKILEFFIVFIICSDYFSSIFLVRNGMYNFKNKSSNLVIVFYYVIGTKYVDSWKKIDKILIHFGDATYQK